MAMYKAKQQGRDTYVVYSEDLDSKLSKRVELRNELQEAMVRWKHPKKGFISPADFIPVAEETGQIAHLGKWVTTQACKNARRLLEMGLNVVAEGVETQEQFCYLKSHGCESFQGYYFARPMLFEDLVQWIGKTG